MSPIPEALDWADYHRRLRLRQDRRDAIRRRLGWSDYPGRGSMRRSYRQQRHPELGGQVAPATAGHGHVGP